jgi:RNA polymerase sigma factor (sigma-70 family)
MSEEWALHQQKEVYRLCQNAVKGLRNRPGYAAIDELEFVMRLYARACTDLSSPLTPNVEGELQEQVSRLAKGVYSEALYHTWCSKKLEEQQRACQEMGDYLYCIAYNYLRKRKCPSGLMEQLGQECTQQTLLQIHRYINNVKNAQNFMGYAIKILNRVCYHVLQNAVTQGEWGKLRECNPTSGSESRSDFPLGLAKQIDASLLESILSASEVLDCLMQAVQRFSNPDWQKVLILGFFSEYDDKQIAATIGISLGNVQTIRHRAIKQLRDDAGLRDCLWGV